MKYIIASFLLVVINAAIAQDRERVEEVVAAERAFADLSRKENTKTAFHAFLSKEAIVFSNGEAVNGQVFWSERKVGESLLFWWPIYAGISLAGDLGYTTGPYYVSSDRGGKDKFAFGYYSTVWKKEDEGKWKVAIDLGVSSPSIDSASATVHVMRSVSRSFAEVTADDLLDRDEEYTDRLNKQRRSFLKSYLAGDARIHRNGVAPIVDASSFKNVAETDTFFFEPVDGEVATSGDLGYTYGNVTVRKKGADPQKLNYLRVWRKDKYGNWLVVLDVIGG